MSSTTSVFKQLQIVHRAILLGIILFITVAILLVTTGRIAIINTQLDRPLQLVAIVSAAIAYFGGRTFFNRQLLKARPATTAAAKIKIYRVAMLLFWALLDGAAIVSVISFLITANYAFIMLATVLVLLIAAAAPTRKAIVYLLQLEENEMQELEGK